MDEIKLKKTKRNYSIALLILVVVLLGGVLWCIFFPSEWTFLFLPMLGAAGAAAVWVCFARFFLCRSPQRRLDKSFKTPLKLAMLTPTWFVFTMALMAIPPDPNWNEDLAGAIVALVLLTVLPAALLCAVVLGIMSVIKGFSHMKNTPETETRVYREAPFAAAILLFCITLGAFIFAMASALA